MCRKLTSLIAVVFVLALACSAQAAEYRWTNDGDGNSWCNQFNWDPNATAPNSADSVTIRPTYITKGPTSRGPVVDCDADVGSIDGPYTNQVMDVISGTLDVDGMWDWSEASGTATINITGDAVVTVTGGARAPDGATGVLNISENADVSITGLFRGADEGSGRFIINVTGGSLSVSGRLGWEDNGGGELNVSGDATVVCGEINYSGGAGEPWTLNLNVGTVTVLGRLRAPEHDSGVVAINLDAGTLECGSFDYDGGYAMDINEGVFIVDGNEVAAMEGDVTAGYITAFNGTAGVIVTYDGVLDKTIVMADFVPVKASEPSPDNYAPDVCPGVELSWQAGAYAVDHNVYFGTSPSYIDENADPCLDHYGSTQWTPSGLKLGTTYYWRVNEVDDSCDASPWVGDPWEFTTNDGNAFDPYPDNTQTVVPIDASLHWTPGCTADSHDVYFGTDYNDVRDANDSWPVGTSVYKGNQVLGANEYDPCDFDHFTYYYWRIDEVDNGTTYKGKVWSFRSIADIPDANLILWYELDETEGIFVSDSSGYEHHGTGHDIGGQWEPNNGHIKGCLDFDEEQHVAVPIDTLETINKEVTVAVWVKGDDSHADEEGRVFDTGGGDYYMRARIPTSTGYLLWRAGNDSNDSLLWLQADPVAWAEEWHHFAFVKDEYAETMIIYFDGFEVLSKSGTINSLTYVKNKAFRIGADNDQTSDYSGKLDDFRIYNRALSPSRIAGLFRGGDVGVAWAPSPYNGQMDVPYDVSLSWMPGDYVNDVNGHDVYFGTDRDEVNDANRSNLASYPNVDYYNVSETNCDPGPLQVGQTYYWRVDEVNDSRSPYLWKGEVWRFTVADFIIIDDFEEYTPGGSAGTIDGDNGWTQGWDPPGGGGAYIGIGLPSELAPVRGQQSMAFSYDCSSGLYYSETRTKSLDPCDWTMLDMKMLSLWFHGENDPTNNDANVTEQLYVGLTDSDSDYAEVRYPMEDMDNIRLLDWTEWNIALSEFTSNNPALDLTNIETLHIGFGDENYTGNEGGGGVVYFDDIRLYPPSCVLSRAQPELDWNNDCIVDFVEIDIMADQWLKSDVNLAPVTEPDPCVLHYKFDETTGSIVSDSSGNAYNGTARLEVGTATDALWEPNGMYDRCIRFEHSEKKYCVAIPNDVFANHIDDQITISLWVNWDDLTTMPDARNQLFSMHGGPDASYNPILGIETSWSDDDEVIFWDADNSLTYKVGQGDWWGGWNHYAFVKDVNVVPGVLKIYHNGQLVEDTDSNEPMIFPADNAWIGMATDEPNDVHDNYEGEWHDEYTGLLDDFRIYDYNLSESEIGYLASSGTGIATVQSVVNLVDDEDVGERAINFRDFDKLADAWLEQKLWPE